MKKTLSAEES